MPDMSKICQQCLIELLLFEAMASAPVGVLWGSCSCSVCMERGGAHLVDDEGSVAEDAHVAEDARIAVHYGPMLQLQQVPVLYKRETDW